MSEFEQIHSLETTKPSITGDMDRLRPFANIGGLGDQEDCIIKPGGWDMKFNSALGNPEIFKVIDRVGPSSTYGDDLADQIF